jgi:hypothetical protein
MDGNRTLLRTVVVVATAGLCAAFAAPALAAKDANHDQIPDKWEKKYNLNLKVKQTHRDADGDKLDNLAEYQNGTNPRNPDTDGDGLKDGVEVDFGLDPTDPTSDDGELPDGQQIVGTISSFDGTTLTINKVVGGSVSGVVDPSVTDIQCDRSSPIDELDGLCQPTDLVPGVLVNYATYDESNPAVFSEIDLVNVF